MEHKIEFRVRYEETDQMGVVYYANYLVWFEVARTEFFRALGVEYKKLEEKDKVYLPVVEAECRYKSPLKYDDVVTVVTSFHGASGASLVFDYEVKAHGKTKASGRTKHVFVNEKGKPIQIPAKVQKAFNSQ